MKKLIQAAAAAALAASGCATVIRGTDDEVDFVSTPSGATVTAERVTENDDNPVSCVTPCKLELSRKRDFNVTFELEGHKPAAAKLSSLVSGEGGAGFLGNALLGGPVGAVVDAGTGAAQDLKPNPMIAQLAPLDSDEESVVVDKEGNPAPPPEYGGEDVAAAGSEDAATEEAGAENAAAVQDGDGDGFAPADKAAAAPQAASPAP